MEWWLIGLELITGLLVLVLIGVPIAASIGIISFIALIVNGGFEIALTMVYTQFFSFWTGWVLLAIPLFVFMGNFLVAGGQAGDIFDMASHWLRRLPGGLVIATIGSGAIFASMTGSSLGSCATFSAVALPQMLKKGYSRRICTGAVCASGALAHLIPPSALAVVYCSLLDLSIGQMLIAGVVPGFLLAGCYAIVAMIWALRYPDSAPREAPVSWKERLFSLRKVWSAVVIVVAMMGTIYLGITTVTEAAGLGAAVTFFMALFSGRLTWKVFTHSILETVRTSSFIMFIAVSGKLLSLVLTYFDIPQNIVRIILELSLNRYMIIIMMMLLYVVLGMFIDAIGMIVITMPIFLPILLALDFSPIWFGILLFINIEIALVSPPFALNVYIVKGAAPDIPLKEIFLGSFVFMIAAIFMIALVMIFPQIALWLPSTMFR